MSEPLAPADLRPGTFYDFRMKEGSVVSGQFCRRATTQTPALTYREAIILRPGAAYALACGADEADAEEELTVLADDVASITESEVQGDPEPPRAVGFVVFPPAIGGRAVLLDNGRWQCTGGAELRTLNSRFAVTPYSDAAALDALRAAAAHFGGQPWRTISPELQEPLD